MSMNRPQKQFRVLFPYNRDRVGGSYISSAQLARYLHEETEFEPIIALPRNAKNRYLFEQYQLCIETHDLRVSSLPVHAQFPGGRVKILSRWLNTLRAWRFLGRTKPDFVHVHDDNSFNIWGRAARWRGIPFVWHVRQEHSKHGDEMVCDWADHIICISEGCKSRFKGMQEILGRISVIYNGIDLDEFTPIEKPEIEKIREELGISGDSLVCGFVGNLVDRKRPDWAREAVKALHEYGVFAQLLFVGEDRGDPPYREQFREDEALGCCRFLGVRRDVNRIMGACDVLLVPSQPHGEPFSRVVAEACALGVPVVATSGVGALELLNPGQDCVQVVGEDLEAYVDATVQFCRQPDGMAQVGRLAHKTAQSVFSYRRMGMQVSEFYRRVFGGDRPMS